MHASLIFLEGASGAESGRRGRRHGGRSPQSGGAQCDGCRETCARGPTQAATQPSRAALCACGRAMRGPAARRVRRSSMTARTSCCLSAGTSRVSNPAGVAGPRISSTQHARRFPKCCGVAGLGAMRLRARSGRGSSRGGWARAKPVFLRLHPTDPTEAFFRFRPRLSSFARTQVHIN